MKQFRSLSLTLICLFLFQGVVTLAVPINAAQDDPTPVATPAATESATATPSASSGVPVIGGEIQAGLPATGEGECTLDITRLASRSNVYYEAPNNDCVAGFPLGVQVISTFYEPNGTIYGQAIGTTQADGTLPTAFPNMLGLPSGTWIVQFQYGTHTDGISYELTTSSIPMFNVRCDGSEPVFVFISYPPFSGVTVATFSIPSENVTLPLEATIAVVVHDMWHLQLDLVGRLIYYPHISMNPVSRQQLWVQEADPTGRALIFHYGQRFLFPSCPSTALTWNATSTVTPISTNMQ